ncbi:MAG: EamA family transporter, partial [Armatimonadetes bacterium]|nr:EamA family transporter [Armatimonadota bacterium]
MKLSPFACAWGAVLLWSTSALFTSRAVNQGPPWLVTAVSFTVAALTGGVLASVRGRPGAAFRGGRAAWALGAIFTSYYLAYYHAFAAAPDVRVEVNLLNYLWPLLTVLLSAPLLGTRLPGRIVVAAFMALAGAALVVTQGHAPHLARAHALGYLLGFWAGVSWALFSCLLRRYGAAGAGRLPLFSAMTAA